MISTRPGVCVMTYACRPSDGMPIKAGLVAGSVLDTVLVVKSMTSILLAPCAQTYAVRPSGAIAIPCGVLSTGIGDPMGVRDATSITATVFALEFVTYARRPSGVNAMSNVPGLPEPVEI